MQQLGLIPLPAEDQVVADLAEGFIAARDMYDAAKEVFEAKKIQLAAHFPEDEGEHSRVVGPFTITVKRGEKWSWDSEALERMFQTGQVPDYVERRLTVHKKEFQKLTPQEQADVAAALTKGVGAPRIDVVRAP